MGIFERFLTVWVALGIGAGGSARYAVFGGYGERLASLIT